MKRTKTTIFIILILAFTAVPLTLFSFATAKPTTVLPDYEPIKFGEFEGKATRNFELIDDSSSSVLGTSDTQGGDWKIMYWYDDTATGGYTIWLTYFQRAVIGEHCEIWVRSSTSTGEFRLDYPDPEDDRNPVIVTMEQLEYLAKEFDENIYPTDTDYFGDEDFHDGSNSLLADDLEAWGYIENNETYFYDPDGKTIIMISNIGDESYYDDTYPNYIAGFYWGLYEQDFDRNIMNIDAYDFVHRVGEAENPDCPWWVEGDVKNRPNLIESIIAHEYQHLIHADWFLDDQTFMNEACSLFAEPLCGYELDLGQVDWFLATPDNSLTSWGEQGGKNILADYGAAFLWALYLTDHYGFYFLQDYVLANWYYEDPYWYYDPDFPTEPKARITELLPKGVDFNEAFHDWRIANLIHSDYHGSDKYNYVLDELRAFTGNDNQYLNWDEMQPLEIMEVEGNQIPWTSAEEEFGETLSLEDPPDAPLGWPTGYSTLLPYSTDYIRFPDLSKLNIFKFDGDDNAFIPKGPGWTFDGEEWNSGAYDLINTIIGTKIPVGANGLLTLDTYWDIEYDWDFGFVQISTDDGATWITLEDNEGYVQDIDEYQGQHPDVLENLPGLTGWSEEYVSLTFDLSDYAGEEIYLGFRYVTDWMYAYPGWTLIDVWISGDGIPLYNIEEDLELIYPPDPEADFMVSIVAKYNFFGHSLYFVREVRLNDLTEFGWTLFMDKKWKEITIVVSSIHEEGFVDYQFEVSRFRGHHRWWK